jgi:hypothetical protein
MRKLFLFIFLVVFWMRGFAQAPNWQWAKYIGSMYDELGISIAVDSSGSLYTTGNFSGIIDFDPGPDTFNIGINYEDVFISKLDASGNLIWAKAIGGTDVTAVYSICLDRQGNIYISGYFGGTTDFDPDSGVSNLTTSNGFNNDAFVAKYDSSCNFIWAKSFGSTFYPDDEIAFSVAVDSLGNVYSTGRFYYTVDFDPGPGTFYLSSVGTNGWSDIFISKLDSAGNFIWAERIGGTTGDDEGKSIAVTPGGEVYITGHATGTVDFNPGPAVSNINLARAFICKLNSSGNFLWAKGFLADSYDIAVDLSGNGDVCMTGAFMFSTDFDPGPGVFNLAPVGINDIFVVKLNSAGNFIWAKAMGGISASTGASSIAFAGSGSGDVYLTGSFADSVDFDPGPGIFYLIPMGYADIFIVKLNLAGNLEWAKSVGGTGYDYGLSVAVDDSGYTSVAGQFTSNYLPFDTITLINPGLEWNNDRDFFVAKLSTTPITIGVETELMDKKCITIFPNPADRELSIKNSELKINTVDIYDTVGERVFQFQTSNLKPQTTIDVSFLGPGIYFVKVNTEQKIFSKKIIISR